ncbi:hypothetical protein DYH09_26735 [bacterium CPR1]|nr:hypothetical protein [bacterium CPR1]
MQLSRSILKKILKLPLLKGSVFAGGRREISYSVEGEMSLTLWADQEGQLRSLSASPSTLSEAEALFESLIQAMLAPAPPSLAGRPQRVLVANPAVARHLKTALAPLHTQVAVMSDPSSIQGILAEMEGALATMADGYLDQEGVGPDLVLEMFEQAGEFWELSAWEWISTRTLLVLEGLTPEPLYCSVLGSEGVERGLGIYRDLRGVRQVARGGSLSGLPCLALTYATAEDYGLAVAREIDTLNLPLCEDDDGTLLAPMLCSTSRLDESALPDAGEIELFKEVMAVLLDYLQTVQSPIQLGERSVTVRQEELQAVARKRRSRRRVA